jgi:hypothetical protein
VDRISELERDYEVVSRQILDSLSDKDQARLREYREEIIIEAREIARRLKIPEPDWCGSR